MELELLVVGCVIATLLYAGHDLMHEVVDDLVGELFKELRVTKPPGLTDKIFIGSYSIGLIVAIVLVALSGLL